MKLGLVVGVCPAFAFPRAAGAPGRTNVCGANLLDASSPSSASPRFRSSSSPCASFTSRCSWDRISRPRPSSSGVGTCPSNLRAGGSSIATGKSSRRIAKRTRSSSFPPRSETRSVRRTSSRVNSVPTGKSSSDASPRGRSSFASHRKAGELTKTCGGAWRHSLFPASTSPPSRRASTLTAPWPPTSSGLSGSTTRDFPGSSSPTTRC